MNLMRTRIDGNTESEEMWSGILDIMGEVLVDGTPDDPQTL